ncbi:hypothetical protein GLAREA_08642 [Glarea lozoyensis ATCC 20868]|uniref:Acyl-CoA N-acyltransferases (Nat) n=2 Tax=Glarea lozoyensis TaxID=101852 RepID=S3DH49_GLAL2|nr:uncharacterized protein GLAREA_08642 [Glarea lozoyensis ATCC 20868]EPE36479.1 hypothetical protein GLAREA_08642 [Glarea lozoyensis ATCC 20868]
MDDIEFAVHHKPGLTYSPLKTVELVNELRQFASLSINPLPKYQIFTNADDKVVVTAHIKKATSDGTEIRELVAFTSAVLIMIPGLPQGERELLHTGLTVISPELRRKGMLVQLFTRLIVHVYSSRPINSRLWITSLAEVPNSLAHIAAYFSEVFPSPSKTSPSTTDLLIARTISQQHRSKMLISPTAVLDEENFVFKGSNGTYGWPGEVFKKDVNDTQYWHRNRVFNDFYRELLTGEDLDLLESRAKL